MNSQKNEMKYFLLDALNLGKRWVVGDVGCTKLDTRLNKRQMKSYGKPTSSLRNRLKKVIQSYDLFEKVIDKDGNETLVSVNVRWESKTNNFGDTELTIDFITRGGLVDEVKKLGMVLQSITLYELAFEGYVEEEGEILYNVYRYCLRKINSSETYELGNPEEWRVDEEGVFLNRYSKWKFTTNGMVICGATGSGKTMFSLFLADALLNAIHPVTGKKENEVVIIDGKFSDLKKFGVRNNLHTALDHKSCLIMLNEYVEMMERMYQKGEKFTGRVFIFVDEIPAIKNSLSKNEVAEFQNNLGKLILLGREVKIHVICITQRPDVTFFGNGTYRDSLGIRVAFGKMSSEGYLMLFNTSDLKALGIEGVKLGQGEGLIDCGDGVPIRFKAPRVKGNI